MTRWPDDKTEARMRKDISDSEVYYESDELGRSLGEDAAALIARIRLLEGIRDKLYDACDIALGEMRSPGRLTTGQLIERLKAAITEAEKT